MSWFAIDSLRTKVLDLPEHYSKSAFKPDSRDIEETAAWINKTCPQGFKLARASFIVGAIFVFGILFLLERAGFASVPVIVGTHVVIWTAVLAFSIALQGAARGSVLTGDECENTFLRSEAFRAFPRVFVVFLMVVVLTSLATAVFVVPGVVVLALTIRAPYEVALGHPLGEAFKRSYRAAKSNMSGSIVFRIFNVGVSIGFLYIAYQFLGPLLPFPMLAELAFSLILASFWWGIWNEWFAVHLIEDALFTGALTENELYATRFPKKGSKLFKLLSDLAPAIALVAFLVISNRPGAENVRATNAQTDGWELQTLDHKKVRFSDLKDKPIVLVAWAPWCTPCKIEVPQVKKLYRERGDDYHVYSVVLSYKNRAEVEEYVKNRELEYPVLMGTDAFQNQAKINTFPTVMIIDKGRVLHAWTGIKSASQVQAALPE